MKAVIRHKIRYNLRLICGLAVILVLFCLWWLPSYVAVDLKLLIERRISSLLDAPVTIEQISLRPVFPFFEIKLYGITINCKHDFRIYLKEMEVAGDLRQLNEPVFSGSFSGAEVFSPSKIPNLTELSGQIQIVKQKILLHFVRAKLLNIPLKIDGRIDNPASAPQINLKIRPEHENFKGLFILKSRENTLSLAGYTKLVPQGEIDIKAEYNAGQLKANVRLRHVQVYGLDLITDLTLKLVLVGGGKYNLLEGQLSSVGTVVNQNPFSEIESIFIADLADKKVSIKKMILGGHYYLQGEAELFYPGLIDMVLDIDNASVSDLFLFSCQKPNGDLCDRFSGSVKIDGPFSKPFCKGKLTAGKGTFKDIDYDSIEANLEGTYPVLELNNSRIYKKDGNIVIAGALDFSAKNLFQKVSLVANGNIVWRGWDIKRQPYSDLIQMDKDLGEDMKIGFKGYLEDETCYKQKDQSEVELELKVSGSQSLKMKMRQDEELLGYEHKVSF